MKKKLIEVALPLEAINREAAREKSIRHGHPSTLHLWWARRPLAACRAVLFSQLVDDPSAHPDRFPTEEAQEAERERLFAIIEDLVKWENSNDDKVFDAARREIRASIGDDPPPVLDPFAGGGSIPLEAQRLGLEAIASDLNPVAVLINKALIEIPPRWAGRSPVHPRDGDQKTFDTDTWHGAQGLAEDVRHYGAWMREQAEARIGHLYPKATLPDGTEATVIAWIWARTVTCPNPACGAQAPLVRSFWLGKKKGKEAWVRPVVEGKSVRFEIGHGPGGPPVEGTVVRSGATCLVCGEPVPFPHVRSEGQAGRMDAQLMAIVAEGDRQRTYLAPSQEHEDAADLPRPEEVPDSELPAQALGFRVQAYGMTRHADLFTNRQLTALTTFSDLVTEAHTKIEADARTAGLPDSEAKSYADAVVTYLGLAVSRLADLNNVICTWSSSRDQARNLFARQAIPMAWDFAENCPFAKAAGDLGVSIETALRVVACLPGVAPGSADQLNATVSLAEGTSIITTDPPYYDNIGYADLSDFFYVWLRRSLKGIYPDLFRTMLTSKSEELVADPYRFGGDKTAAEKHFEEGFVRTFAAAREHQADGIPLTLFYAFKQSETDSGDGAVASTGWETMLEGLLSAGLSVTATWPLRTERKGRARDIGSNALASSIVLACRPRDVDAGITDRRGFLQALRAELPQALREMQLGSIAPVDLAQSAIGPGMGVFSRYAKVLEPSGDAMSVRTALGLINQVLDEVLAEQEGDFDPETRWAVKWFEEHGFEAGPFGDANTLATARGTAVDGIVRSGILASSAGKVSLIARDGLPDDWDPATDARVPVWEATQHLVKRLESGGEAAAADLLRRLGGVGDSAHLLAYRLYAICQDRRPREAGPYNALVTSWPEISRRAAQAPTPPDPEQESLL